MTTEHEHEHDDEAPLRELRGYSLDRAPERDLWPGIQSRLAPRASPWRSLVGYAAAAAIVAAVAAQVLLNAVPQTAPVAGTSALALAEAVPMRGNDRNRMLVHANLKIADDAERQLEQALKTAPDSNSLKRLLDSTRQQQHHLRRLLARPV
jgi:hypothetical protein